MTGTTSDNKWLRHEEREKSQQAGKPRAAIEEKGVEDEAVAAPSEVNKIPSLKQKQKPALHASLNK